MGTENLGQWHEWKAIQERDFVSGTFLWTGIDYMGERNGLWPVKSLASGLLDLAGFEKPSYYMMQSLWTEKPMLAIFSQKIDKSIFKVDEKKNVVEINAQRKLKMDVTYMPFQHTSLLGSGSYAHYKLSNATASVQIWDVTDGL